jgi:hypothetical protein
MRAETDRKSVLPTRESLPAEAGSESFDEPLSDESLTDIIDQLRRRSFRAALERRHASVP